MVGQDGSEVELAKPFQFLNLGVLAYIGKRNCIVHTVHTYMHTYTHAYTHKHVHKPGASEALAQISVDKKTIKGSGNLGFFLWRGLLHTYNYRAMTKFDILFMGFKS